MLGGLQRVFGRYVVVNEAVSAARWRGAPRSEVQGVGSSFVGCDAKGLERPGVFFLGESGGVAGHSLVQTCCFACARPPPPGRVSGYHTKFLQPNL